MFHIHAMTLRQSDLTTTVNDGLMSVLSNPNDFVIIVVVPNSSVAHLRLKEATAVVGVCEEAIP